MSFVPCLRAALVIITRASLPRESGTGGRCPGHDHMTLLIRHHESGCQHEYGPMRLRDCACAKRRAHHRARGRFARGTARNSRDYRGERPIHRRYRRDLAAPGRRAAEAARGRCRAFACGLGGQEPRRMAGRREGYVRLAAIHGRGRSASARLDGARPGRRRNRRERRWFRIRRDKRCTPGGSGR